MPNLRILSISNGARNNSYRLSPLSGSMPHLEGIILPLFLYREQVVRLARLTAIDITVGCSVLTGVAELFANALG